ncbi:MAG: hypothetical protein JRI23_15970 [Deltaproteobacteria bacterium]|nr:hypothetical protein [Deltaproteobacteria bacterium]MBW2533262.1 hypothetical protein [Deltaproteobacteria bacterium]
MRRLEIIRVRNSGTPRRQLMDEVRRSSAGLAHRVEVRLYRHAGLVTDLGVHLHLDAQATDPAVAELGARLAAALSEHGMVEHTVWLEEQAAEGS